MGPAGERVRGESGADGGGIPLKSGDVVVVVGGFAGIAAAREATGTAQAAPVRPPGTPNRDAVQRIKT
jgi:hypothetical protein